MKNNISGGWPIAYADHQFIYSTDVHGPFEVPLEMGPRARGGTWEGDPDIIPPHQSISKYADYITKDNICNFIGRNFYVKAKLCKPLL